VGLHLDAPVVRACATHRPSPATAVRVIVGMLRGHRGHSPGPPPRRLSRRRATHGRQRPPPSPPPSHFAARPVILPVSAASAATAPLPLQASHHLADAHAGGRHRGHAARQAMRRVEEERGPATRRDPPPRGCPNWAGAVLGATVSPLWAGASGCFVERRRPRRASNACRADLRCKRDLEAHL
jgi:hypothetical protein